MSDVWKTDAVETQNDGEIDVPYLIYVKLLCYYYNTFSLRKKLISTFYPLEFFNITLSHLAQFIHIAQIKI